MDWRGSSGSSGASLSCTGGVAAGKRPNAVVSAFDMLRTLPSLTEDTAYITTKNANSSVMKSA